jgi:hypothetical protein
MDVEGEIVVPVLEKIWVSVITLKIAISFKIIIFDLIFILSTSIETFMLRI